MGQYEDRCGVFRNSEGRRHGEYQGWIYEKDEKGARGICPGITMVPKYVSCNSVSVPNNRGGH